MPAGDGGQQGFHQEIIDQLQDGKQTVSFDDAGLGKLMRYVTQYGTGGFQDRLVKAFGRSLRELIGFG
jgi:hypothetical protein